MTITAAIVLFSVIWFLCLFIGLQVRLNTQGDEGRKTLGTPASAPAEGFNLKRRVVWVTVATVALWAPLCLIILSGVITVSDFDFFGTMEGTR